MTYEDRFEITSVEVWFKAPNEEEWQHLTTCDSYKNAVNVIVKNQNDDDYFGYFFDYQIRVSSLFNS